MAAIRALTIVTLGLLVLPHEGVHAQHHIRGRVMDASNAEPIVSATVTMEVPNVVARHRELTNQEGRFDFTSSEQQATLHVHAVGYHDTTFVRQLGDTTAIRIARDLDSRDQLVVTALRHGSSPQESPVSIAVVRSADVEQHNPKGLDAVLRYIPGVNMMEDQVSIRGSSGYSKSVGARVLLMLDGMPFLAADNADMKFDAFPLLAVDRVEVVKGAGSALYGSSALGGVINVLTREPASEPHYALTLYSGFYDQPIYDSWRVFSDTRRFYSAEAGLEGTAGKIGYLATGSYKRDESYRLGDDTYRWNAFAKAVAPLDAANKITLSGLVANENHGGWIYWRSLTEPLMPSDSLSGVNARIHSTKSDVLANWQSIYSADLSSSLKLSNFHTNFTTDPKVTGDTTGTHSSANNLMLDYAATYSASEMTTVTAGISGAYQSVFSNLFQDHTGKLGAAFAQLEYSPIVSLTITPGIRADLIKYDTLSSESQISPKLGVAYRPLDWLALRASYGSGFRAPSIGERFISSILSGFQVRPNLGLVAERSTSYEIGANASTDLVSFDAAVFYTKYRDLIEPGFVTDPGKTLYIQFRNVADAVIAGHEENLTIGSQSWPVSLDLGYTYIYPENSTTHALLQFRSRHLGQATLKARWKPISCGVDFRYISAYETMDTVLTTQITDGDKRVDARVLDAHLGYDLTLAGIDATLTLQVQNLLNYYYVEVAGNLAPLRNYSLRLEAKF